MLKKMSSRRGGRPTDATVESSSWKGQNASSSKAEQLSESVADMSLDDGQWEVIARKTKNRAPASSVAKPWASQASNPKPWGLDGMRTSGGGSGSTQAVDPSGRGPTGRGSPRTRSSTGTSHQHAIPPPLEHGWNWKSRPSKVSEDAHGDEEVDKESNVDDEDDGEDDGFDDTDDDLLSDEFDSDASEKSHGTRKKSRWFSKFFEILDSLSVEEINEPARQWHCPACQGGPGAIDWYRGLQPLITHAKTKGSKRVRLHRELAKLLDEELRRRGTSVIPAGEVFGKWKGLKDGENDHDIVWPPMVVVMNTRLDQDDNEKWIGMGSEELLDYFNGYAAVKSRHSYGPQGHRGMSLLIFESSPRGYLEAERLHKHFEDEGTDRNAWERRRVLFYSGGKRQLYGYMATKEDLDIFNQHSQGKSKVKYEMRSYFEMVVDQIHRMSEDNQQLLYFKSKVAKEQRRTKTLEESLEIVSNKLRKTAEENRIVRQRTQMHHEQSQEELDFQEQFFKDQLQAIYEARDAKEEDFEKIQQAERSKAKLLGANPSNTEEYRRRVEEMEKFIQFQEAEIKQYEAEKDVLIKAIEEKFLAIKKRHKEELLELEKQFNAELASLMDKYKPRS